jgi:DNA-binding LacI/PurR family transcriptional regulator
MTLETSDKLKIAAEAMVDPRTVVRVYDGQPSEKKLVRERIIRAAKKLNLPLPPPEAA